MKPTRLLALGVLLAGVTAAASLTPAQKSAPPKPTEQQKLKERVDALESQLRETQAKADRAAMEKDYITRVQKQYETYYEKAFNSQMWTLGIMGIILTAVFGLTAKFGLDIFDRRIQDSLHDASTQLETKFDQKLADELQKLKDSNAAEMERLKEAVEKTINELARDVRTRSNYQFHFSQALALGAADELGRAGFQFRLALAAYKIGKPGNILSKDSAVPVLKNIFRIFKREDGPRSY